MSLVPTADISAFTSPNVDETARHTSATQFSETLRTQGWAAVTGHGISESKLQETFQMMHRFFALPMEDKMKAPHPEFKPHRGYMPAGMEKSGRVAVTHVKTEAEKRFYSGASDWKETYEIGNEANQTQSNIWPPENVLQGFRECMTEFFERLSGVAAAILEALMMGMELDNADCQTLRALHSSIEHQLRLAHYLSISPEKQKDTNTIRLGPHTDFSCFTILFQESVPGLECQDRLTGEYILAPPREGTLYLNIGQLFERFSNGYYPAALHRVAIPEANGKETIPSRYSMPFFVNCRQDAVIEPMPSRLKADRNAKYKSVAYSELLGDYVRVALAQEA